MLTIAATTFLREWCDSNNIKMHNGNKLIQDKTSSRFPLEQLTVYSPARISYNFDSLVKQTRPGDKANLISASI